LAAFVLKILFTFVTKHASVILKKGSWPYFEILDLPVTTGRQTFIWAGTGQDRDI
jgi:hypothetical protein